MATLTDLRYEATLADYLLLVPHGLAVTGAVLYRLITRPFSSRPKPSTLYKDLVFTAVRAHVGGVNIAQEALITISTEGAYKDYVRKQGITPQETVLESGLKVFWFGPKTAKKVLLFFHGGGYAMAASLGHFRFLDALQKSLSKNHDVAIAMPAYTLSLDKNRGSGHYPRQLQQASEALSWLIEKEGHRPRDIIVAGDSAGAHITTTLMAHLLHPHPAATKIDLKEPLAGAILISPWTNLFPEDTALARFNETSDVITIDAGRRWSSLYLGKNPIDNYNNPAQTDTAWWKGLESKVSDVFIWGGGAEAIIKSIIKFHGIISSAHPRVTFEVQEGAAHDDFILESMLGYKGPLEGAVKIEKWMGERWQGE